MDRKTIINFLKSNKDFLKKEYQVEKIGLFGSYAKQNQSSTSDIDLLVRMPPNFDKYYDLKEYLENNLNCSIDLALEKNIRVLVKLRIQDEIIYV